MASHFRHIGLHQPGDYQIRVQGRLEADLSDWFSGEARCAIESSTQGEPVTCMTGMVADQAALHGLLQRIRDLGLVLLYVECLAAHEMHENSEEI